MQKFLWVIPLFLFFLGCDMNAGCDGTFVSCCDGSTKRHAGSGLRLQFYLHCPFDEGCDTFLYVTGSFKDTIRNNCGFDFTYDVKVDDAEHSVKNEVTYLYSSREESDIVEIDYDGISYYKKAYNKRFHEFVGFSLLSNDHIKFSLIDADKVSKDYDIDVSEMVRSYEYDGDSVRVKVLDNCRVTLFWRKKGYVEKNFEYYRGNIQGEFFSFPISDDYLSYFDCDCWLHKQSSFGTDDIELAFRIYWK